MYYNFGPSVCDRGLCRSGWERCTSERRETPSGCGTDALNDRKVRSSSQHHRPAASTDVRDNNSQQKNRRRPINCRLPRPADVIRFSPRLQSTRRHYTVFGIRHTYLWRVTYKRNLKFGGEKKKIIINNNMALEPVKLSHGTSWICLVPCKYLGMEIIKCRVMILPQNDRNA